MECIRTMSVCICFMRLSRDKSLSRVTVCVAYDASVMGVDGGPKEEYYIYNIYIYVISCTCER